MPANNTKIFPCQFEEIKNYVLNHSYKDAAKRFNVHEETIGRICKKLQINKGKYVKYTKDETFFEKIDSHQKAYILGFLYADGFVTSKGAFGSAIRKEDVEILEYISSAIKFSGSLHNYENLKRKSQIRLEVSSKKMCEDLKKLGCVINKSLILEWPTFLEETDFIWSFLLGVMDGDGYVNIKKDSSITSSERFCLGLMSFLTKKGISCSLKHYKKSPAKSVSINNVVEFYRLLLKNQEFSLERKRKKMQYVIFCDENLKSSPKKLKYGTFLNDSFKFFLEGDINGLVDFVNKTHKEKYLETAKTQKSRWANQFKKSPQNMIAAMELAEKKVKTPNQNGQMLQKTHSWGRAADEILAQIV